MSSQQQQLRWSSLAAEIDLALRTGSATSVESVRAGELISAHKDLLSNPLAQEPFFPPSPPSPADSLALLAHHLQFYQVREETCARLMGIATAVDCDQTSAFLYATFGYSCMQTTITNPNVNVANKQHTWVLSLVLNERRALLLALLNLFSQDHLFAQAKQELIQNGSALIHYAERAQILHEHLHLLLSNPAHRGALEFQAQIAHLIWERNTLFKIIFFAVCEFGPVLAAGGQDLGAILKLLGSISISPAGTAGTGAGDMMPLSPHASSSVMTRPIEVLVDWSLLEKSFSIDCVIFALFAVIRTLKTYRGEFPEGPFVIVHDGLKGLVEICWGFFQKQGDRVLEISSELRALAFLRCILRSTEFRTLEAAIGSPALSTICADFLLDLVDWLMEKTNASAGGGSEGMESDEDAPLQRGGTTAAACALFASRTPDCDSLEDLIECLIQVCESRVANDFSIAFFLPNTTQHDFLQHCAKAAERRVLFKFLASLAPNECAAQVTRFLQERRFFAETLTMLSPTATSVNAKELAQRLDLLCSFGDFPLAKDFCLPLLGFLASPAAADDATRASALRLLTSLVSLKEETKLVVLNHWRRHFYFPGDNASTALAPPPGEDLSQQFKFNPAQVHLSSTHRRSYEVSIALLDFINALLIERQNLPEAALLLHFVTEIVFLRLDASSGGAQQSGMQQQQQQFAFPGERHKLRFACLAIYATALQREQAEFWVQANLLREGAMFARLMEVLHNNSKRDAAEALEEAVLRAVRWPFPSFAGHRRPEWFLAGKRSTNLNTSQQTASKSIAGSFGMLRTNQEVSTFVGDWLAGNAEQPYLFDDGDPDCAYQLASVQAALHVLKLLVTTQDAFFLHKQRSQAKEEWTAHLKLSSLLLTRSEQYVSCIASFVGFGLDPECRDLALFLLDYVAVNCANAEDQVFIWTKPKHFMHSLSTQSDRVFAFLCRHRPKQVLRHSVKQLLVVIDTTALNTRAHADAVRTLCLVPAHERSGTSFSARALLRRYLDFIRPGSMLSEPVLLGLSWTLRLLVEGVALPRHPGFAFEETVLEVAIASMRDFPVACTHLLSSWRMVMEALPQVINPFALCLAVQRALARYRVTVDALRHLTRCGPVLFARFLASSSSAQQQQQQQQQSGRSEITAQESEQLLVTIAQVLHSLDYNQHPVGYSFQLVLLLQVIQASASPTMVRQILQQQCNVEALADICVNILCSPAIPSADALQPTAAACFVEIFPLVKPVRLETYVRRGVFHGMLANSRNEPALMGALERIALAKDGGQAVVDYLHAGASALPPLRLALAVALNDARYGVELATAQRDALLHVLKEYAATSKNGEDALLVMTLLCKLRRKLVQDLQRDEAVTLCLATAVRNYSGHAAGLIRVCLLYAVQSSQQPGAAAVTATTSKTPALRRLEVETLVQLIPQLLSAATTTSSNNAAAAARADLEKALIVLLQTLERDWNAKEDFGVLALLFPRAVGRGGAQQTPSPLETFIAAGGKEELLPALMQRICDLRFH